MRECLLQVLFIANGISSAHGELSISGGDIRWIELAKAWQSHGLEINVLTTEPGRQLCEKLGLKAEFHISTPVEEYSLLNVLRKTFNSIFVPASLRDFRGIIYSTSEGMDNAVPAAKIRRQRGSNTWATTIHWVAPISRDRTPFLNGVLAYIDTRVGFRYIKKYADVILAVSTRTAEKLSVIGFPQEKIFTVECGVNSDDIMNVSNSIKLEKKYDAIFMKRLHGAKGAFDIVDIWKNVVETRPAAKLAMVGGGTKEAVDKIRMMIRRFDIEENVTLFGSVYDFRGKFSLLASSKIFVSPSYEENWAIVIGEAMATGLPVICYDLSDIRPVWLDNVVWVPRGNKKVFAKRILEILEDNGKRDYLSKKGQKFVEKYSWQKIAERELRIITDRSGRSTDPKSITFNSSRKPDVAGD
jgi:glycosyltransferase involved in cell wall biosynthesis